MWTLLHEQKSKPLTLHGYFFFKLLSGFTKRQNFRAVQIQSICRLQNKCDQKMKFVLGKF